MYPGRIALLLTSLLSLINLSIKRPPSSGKVDRLQIWMVSCIGFVFASILTYALILFQVEMNCLGKKLLRFKVQNSSRNLLDNLALIIFPILFAIYSFCYFTITIKWLFISNYSKQSNNCRVLNNVHIFLNLDKRRVCHNRMGVIFFAIFSFILKHWNPNLESFWQEQNF